MPTRTLGPMLATLALGAGAAAPHALAEERCDGAACRGIADEGAPGALLASEASFVVPASGRSGEAGQPAVSAGRYDVSGLVESEDLGVRRSRAIRFPAATAYAATLAVSEDTCMGSRVFGVQAMGFGVSFATTWQDRDCRRLKNARQLDALGYRAAAIQLLCMDDEVWRAMEQAGTPCPLQLVDFEAEPEPPPEPEAAPIASYAVLFDFDSARIRPETEAILAPLLATLHADPGLSIEIEGHTDGVGTDAYNLRLSQRRAQAVVDWLVAHGVTRERLTAVGRGEGRPVADNQTAAGRARNRRVEVRRREPPSVASAPRNALR